MSKIWIQTKETSCSPPGARASIRWPLIAAIHLLLTAAAPTQSVPRLYAEGVAARRAGDNVRAVRLLVQVVKAQPSNADAHLQLGLSTLSSGQLTNAATAFRRTLKLAPTYDDARVGLARVAQRRGKFAEALSELKLMKVSSPEAEDLRNRMGLAFLYEQGVAARNRKEYAQAVSILRQVTQRQPTNADASLQLGLAELALSRLAPADEAFKNALQAAPDYVEARIALSRVAQRRGKIREALILLGAAGTGTPDAIALRRQLQHQALYDEGMAARRVSDFPRAVELFRHLVERQPDHADGQIQLGLSLLSSGNKKEAEAAFRRTLEIAPNYTDAKQALDLLELEKRLASSPNANAATK